MNTRKLLVVDDEGDICDFMKNFFQERGYTVATALSGDDAIASVKKDKPDALLLDIMMPEMDGLTVLKKIRSEDARIPIFITTAFSNEERIKIAGRYNATGFIVKTQDLGKEIKNITAAIEIAEKFKEKRG